MLLFLHLRGFLKQQVKKNLPQILMTLLIHKMLLLMTRRRMMLRKMRNLRNILRKTRILHLTLKLPHAKWRFPMIRCLNNSKMIITIFRKIRRDIEGYAVCCKLLLDQLTLTYVYGRDDSCNGKEYIDIAANKIYNPHRKKLWQPHYCDLCAVFALFILAILIIGLFIFLPEWIWQMFYKCCLAGWSSYWKGWRYNSLPAV